jgi:LysM repeat protein
MARGTHIRPPWKELAVNAGRICTGAFIWIGLPLVAAAMTGCQNKSGGVPMSSSAMDVSAQPVYNTPAPSYTAAPVQPVYDSAPVVASSVTPAYASSSSALGGGTYVVKKGDTLYGISRTHYGDGKKWQQIAAANPGLSPTSLKVGQTITLP